MDGSSWPSFSLLSRSTGSAASSDTSSQGSSQPTNPSIHPSDIFPPLQTNLSSQSSLLISFSPLPQRWHRCTQSFLDYISLREAFGLTALSTLFAGFFFSLACTLVWRASRTCSLATLCLPGSSRSRGAASCVELLFIPFFSFGDTLVLHSLYLQS
ncbi:hypothetical protein BO94DRAFT_173050 [Aspergillus sclerotioniger CBS 115572]|uniref:Uncharacterized protein n=1 Tax=Aspergillus sclerotioniger CBS 115572 TaxID=1450535 RepID=A0A317W1K9_9EURO|nr:hypothetical protein BO94DRAFT_173050 [Aspergillus sclerotioniger CBS 115572]PWY79491.1 hypothetical protein BO94DRAFT_173050 [Aspergillus sclerotioniger CBS 115572]